MEPTRIADESCLLLPSLTRILQKLEEREMIRRTPDPHDRRKQVVQIAPAGEDIIQSNLETSARLARDLRDRMGADRYDALLDLLNELEAVEGADSEISKPS